MNIKVQYDLLNSKVAFRSTGEPCGGGLVAGFTKEEKLASCMEASDHFRRLNSVQNSDRQRPGDFPTLHAGCCRLILNPLRLLLAHWNLAYLQ